MNILSYTRQVLFNPFLGSHKQRTTARYKRLRRKSIFMSLISDFTDFISKGNVLDLAVAFVMGAAFNAVVTALVTDIVTPLIGVPGQVNLAGLTYNVNGSIFLVGAFINSVIAFISIAVAVFFFIVKPMS